MKFIGRKNEMAKLGAEYKRDSSFVVIYGRRRVGKTTLIKEFLKDKTAFYFLATEEIESQSMKRLAQRIQSQRLFQLQTGKRQQREHDDRPHHRGRQSREKSKTHQEKDQKQKQQKF